MPLPEANGQHVVETPIKQKVSEDLIVRPGIITGKDFL